MRLIRRHTDVLGKAAIGTGAGNAACDKIHAAIVITLLTVKTGAAIERRLHDYLLTHLPLLHIRPSPAISPQNSWPMMKPGGQGCEPR